MVESKVSYLTDELFTYKLEPGTQKVVKIPHSQYDLEGFTKTASRLESVYSKRYGTNIGPVEIICHVLLLEGLELTVEGALKKKFAEVGCETEIALQTIVEHAAYEDPRHQVSYKRENDSNSVNCKFFYGISDILFVLVF